MSHIQFDESQLVLRRILWRAIVDGYLQRALGLRTTTVLDLGSGWGEFSHAVDVPCKFAIDIEWRNRHFVREVAAFSVQEATQLAFLSESFDVVFASNVLEHIPSRRRMLDALREAYRVLRPGGRFLVIGPNFKYAYRKYFDFFDHFCEYTESSMVEALQLAGFQRFDSVIPRFLPFSTKQQLPQSGWLVQLYLRTPFVWRFLGQQFLIIAVK